MDKVNTIRTRNCIAYGLGDMYGGGSFFIISTFALYYLINVVGMNPLLAGLIPGLGKIWDAVSDPLMGYISDHTNSKYGKRRVFFLIGIIPIALTFTVIWIPVSISNQTALFLFYFLAYLLFYTTTTMVLIPYSALSAEMTHNYQERNKLTGFRMIFSMGATLLAGVAAQPIIDIFPSEKTGHLVMGIIFAALFSIPWIFVYAGTWELPQDQKSPINHSDKPGIISVFSNFRSIFMNKSFRIHIAMYTCAYAAMDVVTAWLKFFLTDCLQRPGFVSIGLGSILLTQMLMLPVYVSISNKKGHAFSYRMGLCIWGASMIWMGFHTSNTSTVILIINSILIGAGLSAGVSVPFQLLPFIVDVDQLMTGEHRAGTYSGAMTLIRKLIQGLLVLPVLGLLLSIIGYTPHSNGDGIVQSVATLTRLRVLFIVLPIILIGLGILVSRKFALTPKTHKILQEEINRLGNTMGKNPSVFIKNTDICSKLTGMEQDKYPRFT